MLAFIGGILLIAGAIILTIRMIKREEDSWPLTRRTPEGIDIADTAISFVAAVFGILMVAASISLEAADEPGLQACLYSPSGELKGVYTAPCDGLKAPWDSVRYRYEVAYPERHTLVLDGAQYSVAVGPKANWHVYVDQAALDGCTAEQYAAENIYPLAYQIISADLASRTENGESLQHDLDVNITSPLAAVLNHYDGGAVAVQDAIVHLAYLGNADNSSEVSQTQPQREEVNADTDTDAVPVPAPALETEPALEANTPVELGDEAVTQQIPPTKQV